MFLVESDFTPSSFVVGLSPGLHMAQGLQAVWHLEAEPTGEGLVASDLACAVGAELERWPHSDFPISKSSRKSYFFFFFSPNFSVYPCCSSGPRASPLLLPLWSSYSSKFTRSVDLQSRRFLLKSSPVSVASTSAFWLQTLHLSAKHFSELRISVSTCVQNVAFFFFELEMSKCKLIFS